VLNILLHVSAFKNAITRESNMTMLRSAQCRDIGQHAKLDSLMMAF
jgi:hypothetical protein